MRKMKSIVERHKRLLEVMIFAPERVAVLQSHELLCALVLVYGVVVRDNTLAINGSLD
jgi:hypothetical protein